MISETSYSLTGERRMKPQVDDIICRVRAGEIDAYAEIVCLYQHEVWGVVTANLSEQTVTEDLVQRTFLNAYQHLHRFELGRDFGVWLKMIARNLARDERRKRQRETILFEDYFASLEARWSGAEESEAHERQLMEVLASCRRKLPEDMSRAITLRYEEGQSFEQIAQSLDRTVPAAKTLLVRARVLLRECAKKEGANQP